MKTRLIRIINDKPIRVSVVDAFIAASVGQTVCYDGADFIIKEIMWDLELDEPEMVIELAEIKRGSK